MNGASSGLSSWVKDTSSRPQPHHFIAAMRPHYLRGSTANRDRVGPRPRARGAAGARRRAPVRADRRLGGRRRPDRLRAGAGRRSRRGPVRPARPRRRSRARACTAAGWGGWATGSARGWSGWTPRRRGPTPLPDFELAFYDHLLRLDADGRWWFECLWTPERADALAAREAELRARVARAAAVLDRALALGARARAATSWPWPPRASASTPATCSRPTCACGWSRELEGDPLDLFAAGVQALAPDRAAFVGGRTAWRWPACRPSCSWSAAAAGCARRRSRARAPARTIRPSWSARRRTAPRTR